MPFGVRRFSKGNSSSSTNSVASSAPQQQHQSTPQSLEEARDEAHSHVIEELEQVIEKDKSRGMDSVGSNANAPKASARRASGLAAEMLETESVGSRFSNRYEEDLEMGSPSPSRQHRARSAGNGGAGRNSRRVSRSGGGGGASIASRSHYYGESDDDSYVDEEEVSPRRSSGRRYSRPAPAHDGMAAKGAAVKKQEDCCSGLKTCVKVTYDIFRSVPALTLLWAGGAIAACNLGVQRVQTVGATVGLMGHFAGLFEYMGYGLYYIDAVNSAIALLALLFTGATLEILVRKFCVSNGIGGCLKRLSVRSVQAFFFPLAYVGFLAALGLLLLTFLLAGLVLMANQACTAGNTVGAAQAAADLSAQVNTVITWAALKKVAISGGDLTEYCTADHGFTTWFWRMTLIYVGAAAIFQANLSVSAWTIFLNTGHQIKMTQAATAAKALPAAKGLEAGRPRSVSKAVGGRPHSVSRAEAKEMDYYDEEY